MTSKMNQEIKEKWVAALRSGEYQQGQNVLRTKDDKFCCLGVLTDLCVKAGKLPEGELSTEGFYHYTNGEDRGEQGSVLPSPVADWAKIGSINPVSESKGQTLAVLNDGGLTFGEIANVIEQDF